MIAIQIGIGLRIAETETADHLILGGKTQFVADLVGKCRKRRLRTGAQTALASQ